LSTPNVACLADWSNLRDTSSRERYFDGVPSYTRGVLTPIGVLSEAAVATIRVRMAERGYTQAALARETGVSRATINVILKRRRAPDLATLQQLFGPLGLDPIEMIPRTSGERPHSEAGLPRTGQMGEASADYPVAEPSRGAGGDGDNIRETPMGRIARFANPRLRLAFYDALALAEGLTEEEAEALADDLEEVAREERSRHAHRSTDR
jgi:transcriptional regulator with XRE-family HTH domain